MSFNFSCTFCSSCTLIVIIHLIIMTYSSLEPQLVDYAIDQWSLVKKEKQVMGLFYPYPSLHVERRRLIRTLIVESTGPLLFSPCAKLLRPTFSTMGTRHTKDEAQTATGASPLRNELDSVKEAASKPEGCKA